MTIAGIALAAAAPAAAADLGSDNYADLEERIAELEATAARKGNRKVSLTVSGWVNEALLTWDDGKARDAYVVTNETAQDRVRFLGEAAIAPGWKAGYLLELGLRGAREDKVNQLSSTGTTTTGTDNVAIRHSAWYISGKDYGKVWVGLTSDAADGITETNLANTNHFAFTNSWGNTFGDGGNGFFLRKKDGTLISGLAGPGNSSPALKWGNFVAQGQAQGIPGEGHRFNVVKYESPTIAGFTASADWGEDDAWNIALRYAGEFSGFKAAGGIAYSESNDVANASGHISFPARGAGDTQEVGLSASVLHIETGLYASGAWGQLHDDGIDALYAGKIANPDDETSFWTLQAGIERKFFPIGKTTFFGEYFNLDRGAGFNGGSTAPATVLSATGLTGVATTSFVAGSQIEGWGIGLNQNLAEAIDVYIDYKHVDIDVTATTTNAGTFSKTSLEPIQFLTVGALIKF